MLPHGISVQLLFERWEGHLFMGCLSRLLVVGAILIQFLAAALGLLVLGSAGVLGEAALISSSDAIFLFVLLALSLVSTFVLSIKIWMASRENHRLQAQITSYQTAHLPL
jgi:hypothetical protein